MNCFLESVSNVMDIRSENTMSPECQCCQPGIMFTFFKWHYVVYLASPSDKRR